eukprot:COSAG05_NODE_395_length_10351_cov_9.372318_3_plen_97_part_00
MQASCRDLARAGQIWANDGYVPGAGQLMAREYAEQGSRMIFPDSGAAYGYTHWLNPLYEIDPEITAFIGAAVSACSRVRLERAVDRRCVHGQRTQP